MQPTTEHKTGPAAGHITGAAAEHMTGAASGHLAGAAAEHKTGPAGEHKSTAPIEHKTGATLAHKTGPAVEHMTGAAAGHLAGAAAEHKTGATAEHTTGATAKHTTGAAAEHELKTGSTAERKGTTASEQPKTSSTREQRTTADGKTYTFLKNYPHFKLNTGHLIPAVGLGTGLAVGEAVKNPVEMAIRMGYRYLDCSHDYKNEAEVGQALRTVFAEGLVKREDLFILSKLECDAHDPKDVKPACERTLRDLGISYLDMFLVHWPCVAGCKGPSLDPPLSATWKGMEGLVDAGLVRSIGVSNFSIKKLEESVMKDCRIKPAANQVESHPYFRNDALVKYCWEKGIHVISYAPLSSPGSPPAIRVEGAPNLLEDPLVVKVAEKYGKQPAQIVIRWAVQRGTSTPPKSVHEDRLAANLDVVDWSLEEEDFKALCSFEHQVRMQDGKQYLQPEGPYKTARDLWDE